MFREQGGKISFTRVSGATFGYSLILFTAWAASADRWSEVIVLAGYIAGLAFALYGVNKAPHMISSGKKPDTPQPPQAHPD